MILQILFSAIFHIALQKMLHTLRKKKKKHYIENNRKYNILWREIMICSFVIVFHNAENLVPNIRIGAQHPKMLLNTYLPIGINNKIYILVE